MKHRLGRAGLAGIELALVAPVLILLTIASVDFGAALMEKAQISRALGAAAQYATLAGQNNVATATIATNAKVYASAVTGTFVGAATVTASINNGAAAGALCCPGAAWTCSTVTGFTCADGSTPGTYIKVTASYPFKPLLSGDTMLVGKTLSESVVAPLR